MGGVVSTIGNFVGGLFGGGGGGGGGTGATQSSSTTGIDPAIRAAFLDNLNQTRYVANNLGPQQFAGRTQDFFLGQDLARNNALYGPGFGTVDQAANTASRLQNTGPMFINAPQTSTALTDFSGYNAANAGATGYDAANVGATGYNASLANAANAGPAALAYSRGYRSADANAAGYDALMGGAAQLNGNDIANYQNPYTQDVINTTLTDLNRQREMALTGNNARATQARAFGGSRQAVTDALTNEAYDRTAASTIAGLHNQGFDTALNAAQRDVANRQQMGLANLGFGNEASRFNAQAFNTAAIQNAAARNAARQFGAQADNTASLNNQAALNAQSQFNAGLGQQANLANAAAQNTAGQFGAGAFNTAALQNAAAQNVARQFGSSAFNTAALQNASAQNQAGQFNAAARNAAMLSNQTALNNMGQFNANLGFQGQLANQNAFQDALNQQLSAANLANTLGQTQQTLRSNASQNLMNLGLADQQFTQQQLDAIRNLPIERQRLINEALGLNPLGGAKVGSESSTTKGKNIMDYL